MISIMILETEVWLDSKLLDELEYIQIEVIQLILDDYDKLEVLMIEIHTHMLLD
jgi:hypothetical protein